MIYVSSDLHGCHPGDFRKLLDRAGFREEDCLFVLGDVIDRGDWGAELLLWLSQQPNIFLLLGNHEALMLACSFVFADMNRSLDALSDQQICLLQNWIDNGGTPTLKGLAKLLASDPESMLGLLDYLKDAPLYEKIDVRGQDFILVHAGLGNFRADRPLKDYSPQELLLERPTLQTCYDSNATVIFGHTPTKFFGEEFRGRVVRGNGWICIDTGAAMGYSPVVLRLEDMKEFYLE